MKLPGANMRWIEWIREMDPPIGENHERYLEKRSEEVADLKWK